MKTNSLDFDAQALREKILDLAMRGKLVKQDPNDEPASVLLEKIKAEKAELIKEKKIKKSKPLPEITDDEKPFDIPDSWEWVRLGDAANIIMGQAPKGTTVNELGKGIEFHQGKTEFTDKIIGRSTKYTTSDNKIVDDNYIIMAVRAPVGDVNLLNRKISIGRGLAGIMPYVSNKEYIFYYLDSIKSYFEANSTGSTFKAINGNTIKNAPIPLPPLSEQSRIAAKIAQLFALLRKVESSNQQYAKLQTLLKSKVLDLAMRGKLVKQHPNDEPASVLLKKIKAEKAELVKEKKIKKSKPLPEITDDEKPFDIPDSWEWVRLGDIGRIVTGNTPSKHTLLFYGGNIPFIKPADIQNTIINYKTEDYISNLGQQKARIANEGDVLITCIGNLGRNNVVQQRVAYNQQINMISPIFVESHLLHYFMLSHFFIFSMYSYASATTLPILNKTKLSNLMIPIPPLSEQKRIVDKINCVFTKLNNE